jgi:hypothetical protein
MSKTIGAYTAQTQEGYVEFINITKTDDDKIRVMVRSRGESVPSEITMDKVTFIQLFLEIWKDLP